MSKIRNYKHDITTHHRKPRSIGGDNKQENISRIPAINHDSWHNLFQNFDPEKICYLINEVYLDPNYFFVCIKKGDV